MFFLPTFLITYFTGEPATDVIGGGGPENDSLFSLIGLVLIIIFSSVILRKWL